MSMIASFNQFSFLELLQFQLGISKQNLDNYSKVFTDYRPFLPLNQQLDGAESIATNHGKTNPQFPMAKSTQVCLHFMTLSFLDLPTDT